MKNGLSLPNLCAPIAVLFLILIGVLLSLVLTLYASGVAPFDWSGFGRTSILVLWNMLVIAALLCALRRYIAPWPTAAAAMFCMALIVVVCTLTGCTYQILFGLVSSEESASLELSVLARDVLIGSILGGAALRYFHLQGELLKRQRSELAARIESLQARIRPHFLFNSMNIIASLIPLDPQKAEAAVEDLSELFRASLRDAPSTVPLQEEIDLCERYMRLEKLRLGERLQLRMNLGAVPQGARVPPLCLQPLLENAVYHGIQTRAEGGAVELLAQRKGELLEIQVRNPLSPGGPAAAGSGIALANIRDRLQAIYGDEATLSTRTEQDLFIAVLCLPLGSVQ